MSTTNTLKQEGIYFVPKYNRIASASFEVNWNKLISTTVVNKSFKFILVNEPINFAIKLKTNSQEYSIDVNARQIGEGQEDKFNKLGILVSYSDPDYTTIIIQKLIHTCKYQATNVHELK